MRVRRVKCVSLGRTSSGARGAVFSRTPYPSKSNSFRSDAKGPAGSGAEDTEHPPATSERRLLSG